MVWKGSIINLNIFIFKISVERCHFQESIPQNREMKVHLNSKQPNKYLHTWQDFFFQFNLRSLERPICVLISLTAPHHRLHFHANFLRRSCSNGLGFTWNDPADPRLPKVLHRSCLDLMITSFVPRGKSSVALMRAWISELMRSLDCLSRLFDFKSLMPSQSNPFISHSFIGLDLMVRRHRVCTRAPTFLPSSSL